MSLKRTVGSREGNGLDQQRLSRKAWSRVDEANRQRRGLRHCRDGFKSAVLLQAEILLEIRAVS
jgi:hypothetical protein